MKYVVVKTQLGLEIPILFPELINHSTVQKFGRDHESVSAGFCLFDGGKWNAYGESMTLRLKSRPNEDSDLINQYFRMK
jgi:hypothetical protein